jgi:hypothetical protein
MSCCAAPKPFSHHRPGFDVFPLAAPPRIEPAGRISGEGVWVPPTKNQLKTARRGEFFAARPAGSIFGNSGMSGSPFLGLLSFGETKESD